MTAIDDSTHRTWLWALSGCIGALFAIVVVLVGLIATGVQQQLHEIDVNVAGLQASVSDLKTANATLSQRISDLVDVLNAKRK